MDSLCRAGAFGAIAAPTPPVPSYGDAAPKMVLPMYKRWKDILKKSFADFWRADTSSRGAALAFYVVTSFIPVLAIAIGIAGFIFGEEAARGAIVAELRSLLGAEGAEFLQNAIQTASERSEATGTSILGVLALILTSSGVFIELRTGLNNIWHEKPLEETFTHLLWTRVASLGMVLALGLLLLISLVIDAVVTAFNEVLNSYVPFGSVFLGVMNFGISFVLVTLLFATIFQILIVHHLTLRNVIVGAVITALLFQIGKVLIGMYLGSNGVASSFGAAGALIGLLFWVYYSAQIVFLGAALTKAYMLTLRRDHHIHGPG
jgi:membrane protein